MKLPCLKMELAIIEPRRHYKDAITGMDSKIFRWPLGLQIKYISIHTQIILKFPLVEFEIFQPITISHLHQGVYCTVH